MTVTVAVSSFVGSGRCNRDSAENDAREDLCWGAAVNGVAAGVNELEIEGVATDAAVDF